MKVLDVELFHEGIQRNIIMFQRLGNEMDAIRKATEGLVAMDDALKGEGGHAIRSFYEECHLPFLQFHELFQKNFISILERMGAALDGLEPNPTGFIRESFLEGEIEQGLTQIAGITENLTDETNSIMDQVADIVGLPHLDDRDVQEGVQRAKIKRNYTVQSLQEFDSSQTSALIPIETSLATMENWLSNIESLFTDSATDVDFPMERWAGLSTNHPLKTELAREKGMLLDTLLTARHPFQLTSEFVEGSYANSLYDIYIYTTFPGMFSRAKLGASRDESGFIYSIKKSWGSIREFGKDAVDGFKARGDKSFDSVYDFVNHGTFGILDSIWLGSKERSANKWNSTSDFFNYLTAGFTGTVVGAVNPDDPFSKDHLLNSFGLSASLIGIGKVVTPKPGNGVSEKSKGTSQAVGENVDKGTGNGVSKHNYSANSKNHLIKPEGVSKTGVSGGHNEKEFFNYLDANGIPYKVEKKEPHSSVPGVHDVYYKIAKQERGVYINEFKASTHKKTVYDENVFTDEQMYKYGQEAMDNGTEYLTRGGQQVIQGTSNGLKFEGWKNPTTGEIESIYPVLEWKKYSN